MFEVSTNSSIRLYKFRVCLFTSFFILKIVKRDDDRLIKSLGFALSVDSFAMIQSISKICLSLSENESNN